MSRGETARRTLPLEEVLSRCEVVDLSVMDGERWPCSWPTQMPFQQKVWNWFAEAGGPAPVHAYMGPVHIRWMTLDDHCGTHVDAPAHFVPPKDSGLPHAGPLGGQSGEQISLADLMGPAAVVDAVALASAGTPGVSPWITPDHVRAWEQQQGPVRRGEIVLLHTGWDRHYRPWPEGRAYAYDPVVTRTGPRMAGSERGDGGVSLRARGHDPWDRRSEYRRGPRPDDAALCRTRARHAVCREPHRPRPPACARCLLHLPATQGRRRLRLSRTSNCAAAAGGRVVEPRDYLPVIRGMRAVPREKEGTP